MSFQRVKSVLYTFLFNFKKFPENFIQPEKKTIEFQQKKAYNKSKTAAIFVVESETVFASGDLTSVVKRMGKRKKRLSRFRINISLQLLYNVRRFGRVVYVIIRYFSVKLLLICLFLIFDLILC